MASWNGPNKESVNSYHRHLTGYSQRPISPVTGVRAVIIGAVMKHKRKVGGERHERARSEFPCVSHRRIVECVGTKMFTVVEVTECRKNWNEGLGVTKIEHATTGAVQHSNCNVPTGKSHTADFSAQWVRSTSAKSKG